MIKKINKGIDDYLFKRMITILERFGIMVLLLMSCSVVKAQQKELSLQQAIEMGIANSKHLQLSNAGLNEAVSAYNQVKDKALPTANASFAYNHVEIFNDKLEIGGSSLDLPARSNAYIGTASLQQVVFQGNKLRFAKLSADLLTEVARLDIGKNKQEIVYNIINSYYNLYKVLQSKQVIEKNIQAVDTQIKQSERLFSQGLVTKNDVLRFQLLKSNIELTALDLESNRKIIVYNLDILLGLPEGTDIVVREPVDPLVYDGDLAQIINESLSGREELKQFDLKTKVADLNIRSVKNNLVPSLGVGASMYYINPSGKFLPSTNQFISPATLAATLSWNIDGLWMNKNKVAEAQIHKEQNLISRAIFEDQVKTEVNKDFQNYQKSLKKIKILQAAINQAEENDKITESKYRNSIASITDRIDATTQLFQSQINLELAKADAVLAYYTLLKSTGKLNNY